MATSASSSSPFSVTGGHGVSSSSAATTAGQPLSRNQKQAKPSLMAASALLDTDGTGSPSSPDAMLAPHASSSHSCPLVRDTSTSDSESESISLPGYSNMSSSSSMSCSSVASGPINGMDALIGAISPKASPFNSAPSSQSPPTTGFICPSEVMYGKPKLAKNKKGQWKVIVNAGEFTQTVRLEKCLLPNKKCNYVSAQSYEPRCAQVHSYHRLLVFAKGRGFYIDTFRLPTGCNWHVTKKFPKELEGVGKEQQQRKRRKFKKQPDWKRQWRQLC